MSSDKFTPDMAVLHHSHMLKDHERLNKYRQAILASISAQDSVVDIGCGTGALSILASQVTSLDIHAIEYFNFPLKIAENTCKHISNIILEKNSSFQSNLPDNPTVILTETMGQIGPEEHIVESLFDFKKRYPSVQTLIPSRLKVLVQPVSGIFLDSVKEDKLKPFRELDKFDMDFKSAMPDIEDALCRLILQLNLSTSLVTPVTLPETIVDYKLGVDSSSTFNHTLNLVGSSEQCNAVHLFFEAALTEDITLSTHFQKPFTHWEHSVVLRPEGKNNFHISYKAGDRFVACNWS